MDNNNCGASEHDSSDNEVEDENNFLDEYLIDSENKIEMLQQQIREIEEVSELSIMKVEELKR